MSDPMRIGYLVSQYPAASHTFIRREVEALRRRGLAIDTFSIRRPAANERTSDEDLAAYQSTWYVLPIGLAALLASHLGALLRRPLAYLRVLRLALHHRAPGLRALLWSLFHFAESIVLARELKRRGIRHLHNHFANAGANVGLLASQFLGLPWSLTLHGISETDYPAGLLLPEKIGHAQFVACVSWFGRAQAMRITPPDQWPKLFVSRCGLDLSAVARHASAARDANPAHRIVCVGRLSAEKGHLGLLEAFAGTRARTEAELILVGDGPERSLIEAEAARLGIAPFVIFRGRLGEQDTLAEIAQSDLLVLPSFMEGLPIVLMEAMALGVPIVASRVAGVPELVADGEEGLLFRPSDWNDLRDCMARLLTDGALRGRLRAAALEKIEREYAIERAVEPLIFQLTGRIPWTR